MALIPNVIQCILITSATFSSFASAVLKEGDRCIISETGKAGTCVHISKCQAVLDLALTGVNPQACFYVQSVAWVCCDSPTSGVVEACPPAGLTKTGYKAWDYCIDLAEKISSCQKNLPALSKADLLDGPLRTALAPHLATLGVGEAPNVNWNCAGTLISDYWILTEAYCLDYQGIMRYARLGGWSLETSVDYLITQRVANPDYASPQWYHDIALVKLDHRVTFSSSIYPACLHTGLPFPNEEIFFVRGDNDEIYSKRPVTEISIQECSEKYPARNELPQGVGNNTHLCTRPRNILAKCWGSFGSPVTIINKNLPCIQQVVGVYALKTDPCSVIVFTRVAPYLPWIEKTVWG